MDKFHEYLFFLSSVLGFLLSFTLMFSIFRPGKVNFFLGLILFTISHELLFSWGYYSGYNNTPGIFPHWVFKTYYLLGPSIYLYTTYTYEQKKFEKWYTLLYLPALADIALQILLKFGVISFDQPLMENILWLWFIDYLPLSALIISILWFWKNYYQTHHQQSARNKNKATPIKLLLLMGTFTLITILWLTFTFAGIGDNFWLVEYSIVVTILILSFLIMFESQPFPSFQKNQTPFEEYDHEVNLKKLEKLMETDQLFTNSELTLESLAKEIKLPNRYVSNLINQYHEKNFKEFINDYRIEEFIKKAQSPEAKKKTLLALAMESGFNSKSTFNQAFKKKTGKVPSDYLH